MAEKVARYAELTQKIADGSATEAETSEAKKLGEEVEEPPPQVEGVERWLGKLAHPSEWQSNRWAFAECIFAGSFSSVSIGEKIVEEGLIVSGVSKVKQEADKYVAVMYQTEMASWPEEQQKYTLIAREGTVEFKPTGVAKDGWMTCVVADPKSPA